MTQGIEGTRMMAYRQLSDEERWSLAFYVGSLAIKTADKQLDINDHPLANIGKLTTITLNQAELLLFVLAIIFAGKGIAALQEAGLIVFNPVNFICIDLVGIYPHLQGLLLQLILIIILLFYGIKNQKNVNKMATLQQADGPVLSM